jgi:cytochrome c biogenesis factor
MKLRLFFHCLGLSALASAVFLQTQVIGSIIENGYFRGIEQNLAVLYFEMLLTAFAVAYCGFLILHFVVSQLADHSSYCQQESS